VQRVVKDKIHLFNSIPIPSQYYMHTIEYEDEDGEVCSIPNLIYKLNLPPYFKKQYMGIWLDWYIDESNEISFDEYLDTLVQL